MPPRRSRIELEPLSEVNKCTANSRRFGSFPSASAATAVQMVCQRRDSRAYGPGPHLEALRGPPKIAHEGNTLFHLRVPEFLAEDIRCADELRKAVWLFPSN